VSAGIHHSAGLTADGAVYTWGDGHSGQVVGRPGLGARAGQNGHGHWFDQAEPTKVEALADRNIAGVSCGGSHTVVVDAFGQADGWPVQVSELGGTGVDHGTQRPWATRAGFRPKHC